MSQIDQQIRYAIEAGYVSTIEIIRVLEPLADVLAPPDEDGFDLLARRIPCVREELAK